jgi:mannose-6-phosphate isomerase-like protein (cupin superfamily)
MKQYKIDFESMPWESPAVGAKVKAYERNGRQLRLVEFTREFAEPVWCTEGHIGYILEGQLEINFDGKIVVLGPGDGLFIPPGDKHKHIGRALTDVVKIILVEDV